MPKIKICKHAGCHNAQTTHGFCRLHYLKNWKKLKDEAHQKAIKKLNRYIESVCAKNPEKYIEVIKEDIRSKGFEKKIDEHFNEVDEIYRLFSEPTYEEEVDRLIKDLKIEKGF